MYFEYIVSFRKIIIKCRSKEELNFVQKNVTTSTQNILNFKRKIFSYYCTKNFSYSGIYETLNYFSNINKWLNVSVITTAKETKNKLKL